MSVSMRVSGVSDAVDVRLCPSDSVVFDAVASGAA